MGGDHMLSGVGAADPELAAMETVFKSIPNIAKEFSKLRQNDSFDRFAFFGVPRLRTSVRKSSKTPLLGLISFLEAAEATLPRDRLFALLSLARNLDKEDLLLLQPNYKEEEKTIVCRYASVLIRKGYCMKILYQTFLQPEPHGLPSWVADWITPVNPMSKKMHVADGVPSFYRAAGNSNPNARIGGSRESDVLIISGGLVDTIDCIGLGPIIPRTTGPFLPMLANRALDDVDTIFETLSSYPTGESLSEVKWRTLIANKIAVGGEPPRRYENFFLKWRDELKGKTIASTNQEIYETAPEEYLMTLSTLSNQKVCRTRGGYVGLVPTSAEVGDHICVLLGGIVLFALRKSKERFGMFRMVGGCYIHGMMNGEALKFPHWQERSLELH